MIDLDFEKVLSPTRKSWKENMYQSKLFAFITSGWLAVAVISVLLAIVYVLIKIPKELQVVELKPVVLPEVTTQKRVVELKPATNKVATKVINTPATPSFEAGKTPIKKPRIDDGFTAEFDNQVLNLERKTP